MVKKLLLKFSSCVIALLACNFVISCAIVYPIDYTENSTTKKLNFVDARPDIEKVARYTDNPEPTHRFGDENFQPDRMTILEQAFQNRLNDSFSGSTARIKKFEVITICPNAVGASRGSGDAIMFGPILGPALYSMREHTEKDFFACYIEGDIDGKGFNVFDKEEYDGFIDMGAAKKAVNTLIKRTIDMAVKEINSSI